MKPDPANLENLRDIVEPSPVPWWPPAPGWWVVLAIVLAVAAACLLRAGRSWRKNAYRRAALRELQASTTVAQIAAILKRTALCVYPRSQVASLSGSDWIRWLGKTSRDELPAPVAESLTCGVFRDTTSADMGELTEFAAHWIKHHEPYAVQDRPSSGSTMLGASSVPSVATEDLSC